MNIAALNRDATHYCIEWMQAFFSVEFVPVNVENPKKEKEAGNKGALAIAWLDILFICSYCIA